MNTNQKKLKLVMEGIKASTLNKMTEGQVNSLFTRLLESKTEPKEIETITSTKVIATPEEVKKGVSTVGKTMAKMLPDGKLEFTEDSMVDKDDVNKGKVSQDPVQVQGPDGMGDNSDKELQEKFESKKQQKYFFAKCGDGKTKEQKKWCKMADEFAEKTNFAKLPEKKKETKEGYQDMIGNAINKIAQNKITQITPSFSLGESKIEKHIMRLVEKHITPKMKKEDLLSLIEGDTKTAPAKPKEREKEKKPGHPFKPDPNKKGAPKAMKKEMDEDTKTAPAKPKVRPNTTPKHPFQPNPDKKGAPKAVKRELPSFLTFNALGLNK